MNHRPTVRVSPPIAKSWADQTRPPCDCQQSTGFRVQCREGATDKAARLTFDQSWERRVEAEPTEGEARIERESSAGSGLRLIQPPQLCQCSGKIEMREGQIALGIDAPAQPYDRFRVSTEKRLGAPKNIIHQNALISCGERRSASWIWASVSAARPSKYLARPMQAYAPAKFRSSASACSHSAMPCAARFVII
jgi:hypothetical protein